MDVIGGEGGDGVLELMVKVRRVGRITCFNGRGERGGCILTKNTAGFMFALMMQTNKKRKDRLFKLEYNFQWVLTSLSD